MVNGKFYVYVLKSQVDERTYTGSAANVTARVRAHNAGRVSASRLHRPYDLVYTEEFQTRAEAMAREKFFKTVAGRIELRLVLQQL